MAAPDHSPRVAQRRQRILGAAALCFAKDGFARTRIDDVAASAGVSRALVYNHFGTKEELARQVCDHLLDDTLMLAARYAAAGNDVELFVAPDMPHGFMAFPCGITRAWATATETWFERILATSTK